MYTHILFATDLNEQHYAMCEQAVAIAKRFNARLFLLHVIEQPISLQLAQGLGFAELSNPDKAAAELVLATLGEALNIPKEQQFVEIGSIKMHVLEKTIALGCTLIILGHHTSDHMPSFLDSSAHEIIQQAPCDVLTLRSA